MDNQHRKINGYRELSEADIALMNAIKSYGPSLEELVSTVLDHVAGERRAAAALESPGARSVEVGRLDRAQPERWAAIARTHFQEGLMALARSVAQPTTF